MMNFDCVTPMEVMRKYEEADDKHEIIQILADLTASTRKEVMRFLGSNYGNIIHPEKEDLRMKLYNDGLTDVRIAKSVGLTTSAIRAWRIKKGLPSNYKKGESKWRE